MPEDSQEENRSHEQSRWHKFHFSGKVIICSVFLGLGLILIGGLVFAIGEDNEVDPLPENESREMPTKAPIATVGPVIMGIGGFIVVAGVIMCLFETEVCSKKSADSNPLISEEQANSESRNSEAVSVPSKSHSNDKNRQKSHKKSSSPRRSKVVSKKSHSGREKNYSKSPSPRSQAVPIQSPNNLLTLSEDNFMTPPNSMVKESMALRTNSRDAENQTSSSLMKSFTSSGPSWTTSTEFQTPATSFKDTSSSLEVSAQTDDYLSSTSTINSQKGETCIDIEKGFLTPIVPSEEKVKQLRESIQKSNLSVVPELHGTLKELHVQPAATDTANLPTTESSSFNQFLDTNIHEKKIPISELKSQSTKDQITVIGSSSKDSRKNYINISKENKSISSDIENNLNAEEKIEIVVDTGVKAENVLVNNLPSPLTDHQNKENCQEKDELVTCQTALIHETDTKYAHKGDDYVSGAVKSSADLVNASDDEFGENRFNQSAYSYLLPARADTSTTELASENKLNGSQSNLHSSNTTNENLSANDVPSISEIEPLFNKETDSVSETCNADKERDSARHSWAEIDSAKGYLENESSNFENKQCFEDDISEQPEEETENHPLTNSS